MQYVWDNSLSLEKGKTERRKKEIKERRGVWNTSKSWRKEGGKKKPATFKESKRYNAHFKLWNVLAMWCFCWRRRCTLFLDVRSVSLSIYSSILSLESHTAPYRFTLFLSVLFKIKMSSCWPDQKKSGMYCRERVNFHTCVDSLALFVCCRYTPTSQ